VELANEVSLVEVGRKERVEVLLLMEAALASLITLNGRHFLGLCCSTQIASCVNRNSPLGLQADGARPLGHLVFPNRPPSRVEAVLGFGTCERPWLRCRARGSLLPLVVVVLTRCPLKLPPYVSLRYIQSSASLYMTGMGIGEARQRPVD
jgi:hypothetical protein